MTMDHIDLEILKCLQENARQKASNISQTINLSVSAVTERIKKLEQSGIIEGYTASFNQKKLGNDMCAFMEVSLEHPKFYDNFTKCISENKNVTSCYYITGDFDFMLRVLTDSSEGLEQLHRSIKSIEGVCSTKTHFVLSTVKQEVSVLPDEDIIEEP